MSHQSLRRIIRGAERVVGRRRMAQGARLVTMEVRRDVENDMDSNGERTIQRVVRSSFTHPVIFDVGAHFGEWSRSLLDQPGGPFTLHVFEPATFSATKARAELGTEAVVHQVALSDAPGVADLIVVLDGAGANSVVPFNDSRRFSSTREQIMVDTVDGVCQALGVDRITLLKIDAEGHDLAVMRGARGLLGRRAVDVVQFEYNRRWIDARTFLLDAFELLEPFGYVLGKVTPSGVEVYPHWHHELESFVEGNYVAVLPNWISSFPTFRWWGG